MKQTDLFTFLGGDRRMEWAAAHIAEAGLSVSRELTPHTTHLILPLPAFQGNSVKGGPPLSRLLPLLHKELTIMGGALGKQKKQLEEMGARVYDYYNIETLLWGNASLTAEGALLLGAQGIDRALENTEVLVCGWGRIGKLLARKLTALGARVTVSARKPQDLAAIAAEGMTATATGSWKDLSLYYLIYNTVPAPVFTEEAMHGLRPGCVLIDLASVPGFPAIPGHSIVTAPGLPGTYAPESAGRLIGETILQLCQKEV